jgi:glycosyltransferase involved in cell wall biosynthesis
MALISVIIPAYNGEKTIKETIESVLNQTFTDFELIVVNDDSQDSTLDIVNSIGDRRLKVFSYANGGVATNRNRGIKHARGEYIAFLDHDDLWTPDKLESQLKALQENPEAAVAYSWTDYIDENGQFLNPGTHLSFRGNVYQQLLLTNFVENGSNILVKTEALQKVGDFDPSITGADDWDFWLRLARHYHFVPVSSPQVLYRQSSHCASNNLIKQETQCLKALNYAFEKAPESLQKLKPESIANLYLYLTFRALQGNPTPQESLTAARYLWSALHHNPSLFSQRMKLISLVFLKIIRNILFGKKMA